MLALLKYIQLAQREGMSQTTAYGAHRKAGGTVSARSFATLWRLAKSNPFVWKHG